MSDFDSWLDTAREFNSDDPTLDQGIRDALESMEFGVCKIHAFHGGAWFAEIAPNDYWGIIGFDEKTSGAWGVMAQWVWDNWAKDECK